MLLEVKGGDLEGLGRSVEGRGGGGGGMFRWRWELSVEAEKR